MTGSYRSPGDSSNLGRHRGHSNDAVCTEARSIRESGRRHPPEVAIVHDYLTQRGGAERVVLAMLRAFPEAKLYTSLYEPERTYPEFAEVNPRTLSLGRIRLLRRNHRLALPLLAPAFSSATVDADVVICSSSGWAHGVRTSGRKIVYCYTPARWLYQTDRYLHGKGFVHRATLGALRDRLRRWDSRAAASADVYAGISRAVQRSIRRAYGVESELLPPPPGLTDNGPRRPVDGLDPGFYLCIARLLPYKNVSAVARAFADLPGDRLVMVGRGPEEAALRSAAPANVRLVGAVTDEQMRWLYANCTGVVGAAYEDFGLTPVEAALFGKPTAALRFGGYLDTVIEGKTGVFFDTPDPEAIREGIRALVGQHFDKAAIRRHAQTFGEERFAEGLRQLVDRAASL